MDPNVNPLFRTSLRRSVLWMITCRKPMKNADWFTAHNDIKIGLRFDMVWIQKIL